MAIPKYRTHICLVSEQTLPNVLPVLYEPFRPESVVLLATPSMQEQARRLEKSLADLGVRCTTYAAEAYGYEQMRDRIFELTSMLGDGAALNLTCGTKIMALAAFDIARDFDLPAFYLDSRSQQILLLRPAAEEQSLPELLKVKTALAAQGYYIQNQGELRVPPQRQHLTDQLATGVERYSEVLGSLNFSAEKAKNRIHMAQNLPQTRHTAVRDDLLALFAEAGMIAIDRDQFLFRDEDARFYVNGGWLEEYCLITSARLKKEGRIYDLHPNVTIQNDAGVKNELDLAFTVQNQLHLIECKTSRLARVSSNTGEARAAEAAYKLDTLREVSGGTFSKAMLVSYRPLPEIDRIRCEHYRIRVVQANRLKHLREELIQWIEH